MLHNYGEASVMSDFAAKKAIMEAAHWAAPELFTTEGIIPLTFRSDVWSLAITILEVRCIGILVVYS